MKKLAIITIVCLVSIYTVFSQGVSISANNTPADGSAMLDVSSTIGGMLIPRMTRAQRNNIVSPAEGLLIYQIDNTPGFYHYDGTSWKLVGAEVFSIDDLFDGKTLGNNVYLGKDAGVNDDSTNNQNVAVGREALQNNTSGYYNTATGYYTLDSNTTGSQNTAFGFRASAFNSTGNQNTAIGNGANYFNEEGSNNTVIGFQAGMGSQTHSKSGNVHLGYRAGYNDTTDNKLYIENSGSSSPLIYGDFEDDILAVNGRMGIGTQSPHASAALDVDSDTEGLLPPRLSSIQRDAISSPAAGLFIFNTNENIFQYYDGASWKSLILEDCTPSQPGTITGDEYPGCDETGVAYSIDPVPGATYYRWVLPTEASGAGGQGTTSILVDYGISGGNLKVRAENGCGNSEWTILPVTIGIPPLPDTIYGNPTPECNETGVAYSIDPIGGTDNYTWSVPATATLVSGQGTTGIIVDFATAGGDISVRAENNCGNSDYKILAIAMGVPTQPSSISGNNMPDCYETGVAYSIDPVLGATNYTWTVPVGASVESGQGTTDITVDFSQYDGNVSVSAVNSCGGSAFKDKVVNIGPPDTPGPITGESEVCPNAKNVYYSIDPVPGAKWYLWTVPPGATYTQTTNVHAVGIWVDFGTEMGDITVRAKNSCGTSGNTGLTVNMSSSLIVGCNYRGGIIFYLGPSDTLVCAETDVDQELEWGCYGIDIPAAGYYDVLGGDTNTHYILDGCAEYEIAARVCDNLVMNGYNDWVLPSHDALLSMYTELYLAGIGNFHLGNHLDPAYYWSSTGNNNEEAIAISFYEGNTNDRPKYNLLHVRCVRRISYSDY